MKFFWSLLVDFLQQTLSKIRKGLHCYEARREKKTMHSHALISQCTFVVQLVHAFNHTYRHTHTAGHQIQYMTQCDWLHKLELQNVTDIMDIFL